MSQLKIGILERLRALRPDRNAWFTLVMLAFCAALALIPNPFESPYGQDVTRVRGRVVSVDNSDVQQFGIVRAGDQTVQVLIRKGELKRQVIEASNSLLGKMETDKLFQPGDEAYLVLDQVGEVVRATAYDHYRLSTEVLLIAIFALFLIAFAGWSGLRALISFVFALLLLWKGLLPTILLGYDPVAASLVMVLVLSAATLALVAGLHRTALVAFLGSLLGILLTLGLSMALLPPFHLHGAVQPFSETLLYSGFEGLNLTRLFMAAVFLGASGAVLDVAIDVSTAMNEVIVKRPDLSRGELIRSGFAVGRNMTSTMVTTLLMAYASSYVALLMVFMAQGVPPINLLNTNYVAAELFKTVIGSFGLVTVAPFTALMGGLIYVAQGEPHAAALAESAAVQD